VSLSPTPTLPEANPEMPLGEARGRFAVSPSVNLAPENAPGSKVESPGTNPAIGQTAAAAAMTPADGARSWEQQRQWREPVADSA